MNLTDADKRKLDGGEGPAVQHAMEHLLKMGEAFDAEEMVDLHTVHVFSDYRTVGDGGVNFYENLVDMGGHISLPSSCEPMSMDRNHNDQFDWPEGYEEGQRKIVDALATLGVQPTFSCTHYLNANVPKFRSNMAWVEGNATGFANTVIGARGNREDAVTSPLAGIARRIPKYGMLDPANRVGDCLVEIDPRLIERIGGDGRRTADYEALGAIIGDFAYDRIPVVTGLPAYMQNEELKALVTACSPAMTTTLMLLVGISPEARTLEEAFGGKMPRDVDTIQVTEDDLREMYGKLEQTTKEDVDIVISGCPFKTLQEVQELTEQLGEQKVADGVQFYIFTDRITFNMAQDMGLVDRIEAAGALLTTDTCSWCMPVETMFGPDKVIASDSMKMRRLLAGDGKPTWRYGTLTDVVDAAVTGKFKPSRWN